MHTFPTVSVIVIFLNAEQFLGEAIGSILAQSYSDWELLLVDDGSSDQSARIARQCVEQDPERVHYLEHPRHQNRGMSTSRNLGIQHAKGRYIAFLDADDVWLPRKLEEQVAILEAHPQAGMVYGLSQWWYSWAGDSQNQKSDFVHRLGVVPDTLIHPPELLSLFFFQQEAAIPSPSSILVRRQVLEQTGGFEDSFRGEYEDQAFYAKVCLHVPVFAANRCWDKYRQHPASSSSAAEKRGQAYSTRLFFLKWLAEYLDKEGMKDRSTWQLLKKETYRCRHPYLFRAWQRARNRLQTIRAISPVRKWLSGETPPGQAQLGSLARVTPLSHDFGYDRGRPVDRYYIEKFLSEHQADIKGRVLEIGDDMYTCQFGGDRVTSTDVLNAQPGNPKATMVADLTCREQFPPNTYDSIILTQTLQFIYDVRAALQTIYWTLKPGGAVIATFPGISQISRYDMERWGHYWSFTSLSARRLFAELWPDDLLEIKTYGNVLTATAFLYGMASEELTQKQMEFVDQDYEVIIAVRAEKPAGAL